MIKLITDKPHVWKDGEELHIKVLRVHEYMSGRWELVIQILDDKSASPHEETL